MIIGTCGLAARWSHLTAPRYQTSGHHGRANLMQPVEIAMAAEAGYDESIRTGTVSGQESPGSSGH